MLLMNMTAASAQGIVKGKVLDKNSDEALGFVNVKITPQGATTLVKGAVTDVDGKFIIQGLENGQYTLTLTFVLLGVLLVALIVTFILSERKRRYERKRRARAKQRRQQYYE